MKLEGKTILITGGAGLIGSTLIDQLIRDEHVGRIIILDNLTRGTQLNIAWALSHKHVELVQKDIRSFEEMRPIFDGVDAVFHEAAIRITRCAEDPRECVEVLIQGTFNVLEASRQAGVRKIVAASSASVYGLADQFPTEEVHHPYNNRTMYGMAKVSNEGMLRAFNDMYGLDYVALRYFNVYGPRMDVFGKYTEVLIRWLDCIDKNESPKIFGDGEQTVDLVYSEDVARANILALKSEVSDEVFNIASGSEVSLAQLLAVLLDVTGKAGVLPQYLPERSVNPVSRRVADVRKAERLLGFRARVPLRDGLHRLVKWRQQVIAANRWKEYA